MSHKLYAFIIGLILSTAAISSPLSLTVNNLPCSTFSASGSNVACNYSAGAAASITISNLNCDNFSINGTTLTCNQPTAPTPIPTPPVVGPISCGAPFSATKVINAILPSSVGTVKRYFVTDSYAAARTYDTVMGYGFLANYALVVKFTAPIEPAVIAILMYSTNSTTGLATRRTATLSSQPCDFVIPKSSYAFYATDRSQTINLTLRTDGVSQYGHINVVPGQTYYLNVSNFYGQTNTCTPGRCDVYFSFGK